MLNADWFIIAGYITPLFLVRVVAVHGVNVSFPLPRPFAVLCLSLVVAVVAWLVIGISRLIVGWN